MPQPARPARRAKTRRSVRPCGHEPTKRDLPAYCYTKPEGVYFQRRGWDTVRMTAQPGTPEFAREYALILQGTPPIAEV